MSERMLHKPDFGNWVSRKFICAPALVGLTAVGVSLLWGPVAVFACLCLAVAAYFAYARYLLGRNGNAVQNHICSRVLNHLEWDGEGRALDIGCGNGPLTVGVARAFPRAHAIGCDYWGTSWDYAKDQCERNARVEGVGDRVSFQKASASHLPFEDGSFDAVVSNLVFHEVNDVRDKRDAIKEALRVLKKGGCFAFQDLFLTKRMYGSPDELVGAVRSWGVSRVEFVRTRDEAFIPGALKLPFMVGTMAMIYGEK
jgi:SAM-dependent methyltransferase